MAAGSSCLENWTCDHTKGAWSKHYLITGPKYLCMQQFQLETKVSNKHFCKIQVYSIIVFRRTILKIPNWTFPFSHASDKVEIDWNNCISWTQRPRTEVWPQNTSICEGQFPSLFVLAFLSPQQNHNHKRRYGQGGLNDYRNITCSLSRLDKLRQK